MDYLLRAFGQLQRRSDQEVSLLLVGDGVDERELRATSAALGLRNVVFAGFKQKPELPAWYALADVFVFPSLGDPYGLVVDEAMACSLPVISTTTAGEIGSRLADGIDGYLVPPRDSSALFRRMAALAGDPGLRLRMGRHGFERDARRQPGHLEHRIRAGGQRASRTASRRGWAWAGEAAVGHPSPGLSAAPTTRSLRLAGPLARRGWETLVVLPVESGNADARFRTAGLRRCGCHCSACAPPANPPRTSSTCAEWARRSPRSGG